MIGIIATVTLHRYQARRSEKTRIPNTVDPTKRFIKSCAYMIFVPGRIQTLTKLCGLLRELEETLGGEVDIVSEESSLRDDFTKGIFRDRKLIYES